MRRFLWLAVALTVLMLTFSTALAGTDPLTPDRPASAPPYSGNRPPLYDDPSYEPWAYTFEGDRFGYADYTSFYSTLNQLLTIKAWLMKLAIRSVEYALAQDWFKTLGGKAGDLVGALGSTLWEQDGAPLVVGALSLAGLWALLLYLRGRVSAVWASLGGTALVLGATAMILASGSAAAGTMVAVSREMTLQVFASIDKVSGAAPGEGGLVVRNGDAAWRTLVYEPWLQGQFGSVQGPAHFRSPDGVDGGRMLGQSQDYRLQWFLECQIGQVKSQERYCPWWGYQYLPRRMALTLWTSAATLLYAGALVILAGGIALAQLSLLFLLVLAPVWLMVALWWPGGGAQLLRRLLLRMLGSLVTQAVLAATLGVLLLLGLSVRSAFLSQGWMLQSILLAALGGLALRYRYSWLFPRLEVRAGGEERLWDRLRGWVAPQRHPAVAAAAGAAAQPVPVFSALPGPPPQMQAAVGEIQRVVGLDPTGRVAPSQRVELAQAQMRMLREHLSVREEVIRTEMVERESRGQTTTWEEPAPVSGSGTKGGMVREPGVGGGARTSDAARIPTQRPKA